MNVNKSAIGPKKSWAHTWCAVSRRQEGVLRARALRTRSQKAGSMGSCCPCCGEGSPEGVAGGGRFRAAAQRLRSMSAMQAAPSREA